MNTLGQPTPHNRLISDVFPYGNVVFLAAGEGRVIARPTQVHRATARIDGRGGVQW